LKIKIHIHHLASVLASVFQLVQFWHHPNSPGAPWTPPSTIGQLGQITGLTRALGPRQSLRDLSLGSWALVFEPWPSDFLGCCGDLVGLSTTAGLSTLVRDFGFGETE